MFKKWISRRVLQKHSGMISKTLASMTDAEFAETEAVLDDLYKMVETEAARRLCVLGAEVA